MPNVFQIYLSWYKQKKIPSWKLDMSLIYLDDPHPSLKSRRLFHFSQYMK